MSQVSETETKKAAQDSGPLRSVGVGAIVSAGCYVLQPVVVFAMFPPGSAAESEFATVAELAQQKWLAIAQALIFAGVGVGFAVVVVGLRKMQSVQPWGLVRELFHLAGLLVSLSWMLLAGLTFAGASSVAMALAQAAPDPALQRGVIQGASIIAWGSVSAAAVGFCLWLVGLALTGSEVGVVGKPLTVVSWAAAGVVAVGLLGWSQGGGVLIMVPFLLAFGVRQLRAARMAVQMGARSGLAPAYRGFTAMTATTTATPSDSLVASWRWPTCSPRACPTPSSPNDCS